MKAALLNKFGSPLEVGTLPDPVPGAGEIVIDVVAAGVLSYTGEVFSGMRNYEMELPLVPGIGAIGRVRAAGPDSTRLKPGDWVACDVTVRSRVTEFSLDDVNQAVEHAAGDKPFMLTVVRP